MRPRLPSKLVLNAAKPRRGVALLGWYSNSQRWHMGWLFDVVGGLVQDRAK